MNNEQEYLNDYNLFFEEILKWIDEVGFKKHTKDSWDKTNENRGLFYSFEKGIYRIEIKKDWNLVYSHYDKIEIGFWDFSSAGYSNVGFIGYIGQKHILTLKKPFTRTLFDEIIKHFNV